MSEPLWQTLLNLALADEESVISCQDCYHLLDQYADMLLEGANPSEVMALVKEHLGHCSGCDEVFDCLLLMAQAANQSQQQPTDPL
jgi:predicted anti-sigma-YlaC factor YlaD